MQVSLSKLGLSAAQLPFEGGAGRVRPVEAELTEILSIAARAGLSAFDAGGVHGQAEAMIGKALARPCRFKTQIGAVRADRGPDFVEAEARNSLARLGLERAHAVIVQSPADLFGPHGAALWDKLADMVDQGLFAKVGVSLYASDDPVGVAKRFKPDIVQLPASLLDQRLIVDGTLATLAEMGIEVHLRSIFLHGLLFLPPDRVPGPCRAAASRLSRVRRMIAEGRSDPLQAALSFALSRPEAAAVIVGAASAGEMSAICAAAASPPPDLDWDDMALDDEVALDPRRWVA